MLGNPLLRSAICLFAACSEAGNELVCIEARMVRQWKLKRHDGSEAIAMAAETSVKVSHQSLHDERYSSLTLGSPSDLRGNTCTPHSRSQ